MVKQPACAAAINSSGLVPGKLFNRVGRGIELTEAGHVFLAGAKAILARVEAAELTLNEFGSMKRGTLTVQASQTIASYWLPRHLVGFRQAYRAGTKTSGAGGL